MEYLPQWLLNTNILVSIFGWLYESNCLHTCVSIGIMQALVRYPSFSLMGTAKHPTASTFLHLPDALVKSIAEYVCEVWSHTYVNLYQLVMLLCTETWVGVPKRKITIVKHWHIPTLPYEALQLNVTEQLPSVSPVCEEDSGWSGFLHLLYGSMQTACHMIIS